MKRLFSLLALAMVIAISNCTRVPENNDPILGIWSKAAVAEDNKGQNIVSQRQEWIFNDAFLGRYHSYADGKLEFYTDFGWSVSDGMYTIEYRGTDMPDAHVTLKKKEQPQTLAQQDGSLFATRE